MALRKKPVGRQGVEGEITLKTVENVRTFLSYGY
jgi:hypothetical protein